jgi:hypothetical protein
MALKRGWVTYTTSDDIDVTVKCSAATAAENGVSLSRFPTETLVWGWDGKDLRHLCGVAADGSRSKMMIVSAADFAVYAIGVDTFTNSLGVDFTVTSKIGERMDSRDAR